MYEPAGVTTPLLSPATPRLTSLSTLFVTFVPAVHSVPVVSPPNATTQQLSATVVTELEILVTFEVSILVAEASGCPDCFAPV